MTRPPMRDVEALDLEATGHKGVYDQSWAIVIGINGYEHQPALTVAVPDAASVAETLISRYDFPPRNVFLVLDPPKPLPETTAAWLEAIKGELGGFEPRATKAVLERLLVNALAKRTGADDRVLVYFAGHGTSRTAPGDDLTDARPYLIPSDGLPSRWDTYIDLRTALAEGHYLAAKHVLYLLDACCAGLVGTRMSGSGYEHDALHKKARQCITAGTAESAAVDLGADGHSPFTGELLRVLRGDVRLGDDELISTTTLIPHLKKAVHAASGSLQTPDYFSLEGHGGGEFIFSASKAPLTLDERAVLARLLVHEIGLRLEEPIAIELAATLWRAILETGAGERGYSTEARRELARAYLLLDKHAEALDLIADTALEGDPEVALLRGLAYLRREDRDRAEPALRRFAEQHPDHRYAAWAQRAAESTHRRRRALLVGVASIAGPEPHPLRGVDNDIAAMADLLRDQFGFDVIEILQNEQATTANLRAALAAFAQSTHPEDSFLFYFSGHGARREVRHEPEGRIDHKSFLATYDWAEEGARWFSEDDLDDALQAIPAQDKVVITDGCYMAPELGRPLSYRYLAAGQRDQIAREGASPDGRYRGTFTLALEHELRRSSHRRLQDIWPRVQNQVTRRSPSQTPLYVGAPSSGFVNHENMALRVLDLGERGLRGPLSLRQLERCSQWLHGSDAAAAMAPFWLGVGRALLAQRRYAASIDVLASITEPETWIPLLRARLLFDRYREAADSWTATLQARAMAADDLGAKSAAGLSKVLDELKQAQRHALLVMVQAGTGEPWTEDSLATLTAIRDALVSRCGFSADHIAMRCDPDREALRAACCDLAIRAGDQPAFFVFVGPGFDGNDTWIGSTLSQAHWTLSLTDVTAYLSPARNLTAAVFITENQPSPEALATAALHAHDRDDEDPPPLGRATLVVVPAQTRDSPRLAPLDRRWLVDVLAEHGHPSLSAGEWASRMQELSDPQAGKAPAAYRVRGDGDGSLFSYVSAQQRALEALQVIEQAPLRRMLPLLTRLAAERELAASAYLARGIVAGELERYDEARSDLDAADERHRPHRARGASPPAPVTPWAELHYQRGRILLEAASGAQAEYTEAVAELTAAVRSAPDHARAHYYRALAIRRLIEADLERQARDSEQRYRDLGAPLGIDDDERHEDSRVARR